MLKPKTSEIRRRSPGCNDREESRCCPAPPNFAVVIRLILVLVFSLALLGIHSLDSARGSAAIRGFEAEVDVLLRVEPDDERGNVDELLAHANVTLADEDASVMDRLGEAKFEDLRLQTAFEEIFDAKTQNVIEFHLRLIQDADSNQTTEESVTFEQSSRVLLLEREQNARRFPDFGEGEFDAPDLAFVTEAEFADELQLLVQSFLLEWTTGRRIRLRCLGRQAAHFQIVSLMF